MVLHTNVIPLFNPQAIKMAILNEVNSFPKEEEGIVASYFQKIQYLRVNPR